MRDCAQPCAPPRACWSIGLVNAIADRTVPDDYHMGTRDTDRIRGFNSAIFWVSTLPSV